jgi:AraC-like DNA-binding protein
MFSFSTDGLPEQDRFEVYRTEVARKHFHWDVTRRGQSDCRFAVRVQPLGPVQNATCEVTPVSFRRRVPELKGGPDGFMFIVNRQGRLDVAQGERRADLKSGSATLIDHGRPAAIEVPEPGACWGLFLDRAALLPLIRQSETVIGQPIGAANQALRLLVDYLKAAEARGLISDPELARLMGMHVIDLIAAAVGVHKDAADTVANRGVRAGRLAAIRAQIAARACDPTLTSGTIAGQIGVSERYVRRILEETGETFSGHLLESRLQLAWRRLTDPRYASLRISEIAYETGFNDLSNFNRKFRRRFGETPSEVRADSLKRGP